MKACKTIALAMTFLTVPTSVFAAATTTNATYAIVLDYQTNTVMFAKDADVQMPPASMSKLMTVYILLEKLKSKVFSLDDTFTVSKEAWKKGGAKTGGSTMFLKIGQKVKIRDLLQGIIVQSGNDACIVTAEGIAGSEDEFVKEMNKKAADLGLQHSHFKNSTGWPDKEHIMSASDIAKLSARIISDFPEYYPIFSQTSFTFNGIKQENRNPLLLKNSTVKADGLKTGHTEKSGFGLAASALTDDGRRIIVVINGTKSMKERGDETVKLLNWATREFEHYTPVKANDIIGSVPVFWGVDKEVPAAAADTVLVNNPKTERSKIKVVFSYQKPIKAPVKKGTKIGTLTVSSPNFASQTIDVVAGKDVAKIGYMQEFKERIKYLLGIGYE